MKYTIETVDGTGQITTLAKFVDHEEAVAELQRQWDAGNVTAHISEDHDER